MVSGLSQTPTVMVHVARRPVQPINATAATFIGNRPRTLTVAATSLLRADLVGEAVISLSKTMALEEVDAFPSMGRLSIR